MTDVTVYTDIIIHPIGKSSYTEAFVEVDGWRWRICESDPGMIEVHYQEWDEKLRTWTTHDGGCISFSSEYADAICKAIQRVKSGV